MRQAIVTKFVGPTNTKGGRIIAQSLAGKLVVPYDHALPTEANHTGAAVALARLKGWTGSMIGGGSPDCSGFCFVFETVRVAGMVEAPELRVEVVAL